MGQFILTALGIAAVVELLAIPFAIRRTKRLYGMISAPPIIVSYLISVVAGALLGSVLAFLGCIVGEGGHKVDAACVMAIGGAVVGAIAGGVLGVLVGVRGGFKLQEMFSERG